MINMHDSCRYHFNLIQMVHCRSPAMDNLCRSAPVAVCSLLASGAVPLYTKWLAANLIHGLWEVADLLHKAC